MEGKMNLQDTFLNEARKENVPVSIFLMNGVQLKGKVKSFDSFHRCFWSARTAPS